VIYKELSFLLAVVVLIGLLAASPVLALERAGTGVAYLDSLAEQRAPDDLDAAIYFTHPLAVPVMDLSGNVVGEGVHVGAVKCAGDRCRHQTYLGFDIDSEEPRVYEYKFGRRLAINAGEQVVVVEGKGTIFGGGQRERFSFTATFRNNGDGTVFVTYAASRPDASFIIASAPGSFDISRK
jgi:hypothetical protein